MNASYRLNTCSRGDRPQRSRGARAAVRRHRDVHGGERPQHRGFGQEDREAREPWRGRFPRARELLARGARVRGAEQAPAQDGPNEAPEGGEVRRDTREAQGRGASEPGNSGAADLAAR